MNRYRLKLRAGSGGATIRATADRQADVRGTLHLGEYWWGDEAIGGMQTVDRLGAGCVWIVDARGWAVWAGMLDRIFDGS